MKKYVITFISVFVVSYGLAAWAVELDVGQAQCNVINSPAGGLTLNCYAEGVVPEAEGLPVQTHLKVTLPDMSEASNASSGGHCTHSPLPPNSTKVSSNCNNLPFAQCSAATQGEVAVYTSGPNEGEYFTVACVWTGMGACGNGLVEQNEECDPPGEKCDEELTCNMNCECQDLRGGEENGEEEAE